MSTFIVKVRDRYCEWSDTTDAPSTALMDQEEFRDYYAGAYGWKGSDDYVERMKRVEKHGTSAIRPSTTEEMLAGNRAGPDEIELSAEEIYERYTPPIDWSEVAWIGRREP